MHTVIMSWLGAAFAYDHRRRRQEARAQMRAESAAPPAMHPLLGLGGRSIELSLARGLSADEKAFQLATTELHERVTGGDTSADELRESARWLREVPNYMDMPEATRDLLSGDIAALTSP